MTSISFKNNFDAHNLLVGIIKNSKVNFVQMGAVLKYLKEKDRFKETTGGVDTWQDYISQPEVQLSQSEANRLISIFETFCEKFGYSIDEISEIPVKNIHYLLPIAKKTDDKTFVENLLEDAKVLSQKDFREKIFEDKGGVKTYEYILMQRCIETGTMRRIHDIESEALSRFFNLAEHQEL